MTKAELAGKLATRVGLTRAKAAEVVEVIFSADGGLIARELSAGRKVTIPGFGTFGTRMRAARTGRNPATGKAITIPSRRFLAFRVGSQLAARF